MASELFGLLQQTLTAAIALALPMLLAAILAGVASTLLASLWGVQDPVISLVLRTLAIVAAVSGFASEASEDLRRVTLELWAQLPAIGRGER